MSETTASHTPLLAKRSITPTMTGLLQRACACGQHTGSGGECEECKKKREGKLQRSAISHSEIQETHPSVEKALRSPGQPLDSETRAYMEPRFGHDFSSVRVHDDALAASSARAVNALAYTVGRDVVFGNGQYSPSTDTGRRLIAHELTHTIQQAQTPSAGLQKANELRVGPANDVFEQEAEAQATRVVAIPPSGVEASLPVSAPPDKPTPVPMPTPTKPTPKVPPPTTAPVEAITSETVVTDPTPRTRTKIGVGEEVKLTHTPGSAAWSVTAGKVLPASGASTILSAPDTAQKITATGGKATLDFEVIAPNAVFMERFGSSGVKHTKDHADSGIEVQVFLLPDTVNFNKVIYHEGNTAAVVTKPGPYSCFDGYGHCRTTAGGVCADISMTSTVTAKKGTQATSRDCVYSGDCQQTPPFKPGSITYTIPYDYKIGTGSFHLIRNVTQVSALAADLSTLTSSKVAASGSTTVAAASLTNPASGGATCP